MVASTMVTLTFSHNGKMAFLCENGTDTAYLARRTSDGKNMLLFDETGRELVHRAQIISYLGVRRYKVWLI